MMLTAVIALILQVCNYKNTATGEAGGCSYAGIALYSSLTRKTRKYDLPAA